MAGNAEWLAKAREEALEPALPIIDPHHHLRDQPGSRHELDEPMADTAQGHDLHQAAVVTSPTFRVLQILVAAQSTGEIAVFGNCPSL